MANVIAKFGLDQVLTSQLAAAGASKEISLAMACGNVYTKFVDYATRNGRRVVAFVLYFWGDK